MKKRILLITISILCVFLVVFTFTKVKADSGWDTDYDSDWGSDSGWSSDYDSDWGSDSRSSHSSGSGSSDFYILMLGFLLIFGGCFVIYRLTEGKKKNRITQVTYRDGKSIMSSGELTEEEFMEMFQQKYDDMYNRFMNNDNRKQYSDVDDEVLAKYDINKDEFKQMVYQKYVMIQNAWMNFDYDMLKNNLTDELYNSYVMQLDALKIKKQKNVMSDFENIDVKIIDISSDNGIINVKTYLRVCMYDYVVDERDNVVRGNRQWKVDIEYIIDFVRENDIGKLENCPYCGAKLTNVTGGVCEYCRTKIVLPAKDYVMSRKKSVSQRRKS